MNYLLGLDIGARSIGWAVLEVDENWEPFSIEAVGVRCFEAGVEGDIEQGKDASRAVARRDGRQQRRQIQRRSDRKRKVFRILQEAGLLPRSDDGESAQRDAVIKALDAELAEKFLEPGNRVEGHLLPYKLRALAVSEKLSPFALGRALYHLAQRRGYQSNRKADASAAESDTKDDEQGTVVPAINSLREELNGRTLGQYYATLDPEERRIRRNWTGRQMYKEEFERIWQTQSELDPERLTDELKDQLFKAIFFQRPLRSQRHLIGRCSLEPDRKRAPIACDEAQQARILQQVAHLRLVVSDGSPARSLSPEEAEKLIAALNDAEKLTWTQMRKLLGLPKKVQLDKPSESDEKHLIGNRTRAKMLAVFGEQWDEFSPEERERIVFDVLHYRKPDALKSRAQQVWGLTEDQAGQLSNTHLEQSHAKHSREALRRLNEALRADLSLGYSGARKLVYPESHERTEPQELLPPVKEFDDDLRNPAVTRALTELRRVVNALIRRYGKPVKVHIETARDLKRPRPERERLAKQNRQREKERENAKARILEELPNFRPSERDKAKVLLADECNWECPYTGRKISMRTLLGAEAEFDVEHIYPRRFLDDSFANKTLCYHDENRHVKGDRLPREAYAGKPEQYEEILQRVAHFKGAPRAVQRKLERFRARVEDMEAPEFAARQLNDTRYSSRAAAEYLGTLYGGRYDAEGNNRVETLAGQITAKVRNALEISKGRETHRHHAVDAVVIGLTTVALRNQLSKNAAREAWQERVHLELPEPWAGFRNELNRLIGNLVISHRVDRKLSGALHQETNYSPCKQDGKVRTRKPISALTKADIANNRIVDPVVRTAVEEALGSGDPKKVFADEANYPTMPSKNGRTIPIKKVRIAVDAQPIPIGGETKRRFVKPGNNHHSCIVAKLNKKGEEVSWSDHPVTLLEATRRKREGLPVIWTDWGDDHRLKLVLMAGDSLGLTDDEGEETLYVVRSLSKCDYELVENNEARQKTDLKKEKQPTLVRIKSAKQFILRHARMVEITPLGEVHPRGLPSANGQSGKVSPKSQPATDA